MANYYKVAAAAVAEAFDGTQARGEELVAAYEDLISIQEPSVTYPELVGNVTVDVATTGIIVDVVTTKEDIYSPYEIIFTITGPATATDDLSITFFEEDPVTVAVTDEDDALTIAAALTLAVPAGFTATDNEDGTVTVTQDLDDQGTAILAVISEDGQVLNAYKDTYIVWIDEMQLDQFEVSKTQVWSATNFVKYFIEIVGD